MSAWIGVDLDGTLAEYHGWVGAGHIGAPIKPMVERVQRWLNDGHQVRIFTARVSDIEGYDANMAAIRAWCTEHIGLPLAVTNVKDLDMLELWDDRAVQVVANTGEPVGMSTRGLS